jgi:hypothetical protein
MIYNNQEKRNEIVQQMPDYFSASTSKVLAFINLCVYPQKFEVAYHNLREQPRISATTYDVLKGAITGLLVLANRQHKESRMSVDEYVIDFIEFIRKDTKGDPVKFLLSMKRYMPRYLFIKGLSVSFGVDWRRLVADALDLKKLPKATNYHSICTNLYVRNLLRAYVVYKNYKETHDEGYEQGVNDVETLLKQTYAFKTALPPEKMVALFQALCSYLPNWSYAVRRKVAWAIDTSQDGRAIIERQFTDYRSRQIQGV